MTAPNGTSLPNPTAPAPGGPGLTLVMGGGGFKGLAHVGVLSVLEEAGLPIERFVATSAGALIAAAYSHCRSAAKLRELVLGLVTSDPFQSRGFLSFASRRQANGSLVSRVVSGIKRQVALERMFRRSSAFGGAALRYVVSSLVPKVQIEDLLPPLAVAALDLERGEQVLLTSGPLASAVCASSSVPGFFPPVERDGRLLCDAGIVDNLPTRFARGLGALRIVAVDLSASLRALTREEVGLEVLLRAQDISTHLANRRWADDADVVLSPRLSGRSWLDPSEPEGLVAAGAAAARAALPDLQRLLSAGGGLRGTEPVGARRAPSA